MEVKRFILGLYQTNCYCLIDDNNCVLIDPGYNFKRIKDYIDSNNLSLKAILLTHGHFDHIGAVDDLVEQYNCKVYLSSDDYKLVTSPQYNNGICIESKIGFIESERLQIDNFCFEVYFTPGHTVGSVIYKIDNCLFTGDTLFKNSVGRTDLYSGSQYQLLNSLKLFYLLDENLIIYPGHDEITTLKDELKNNPYL